MKRKKLLLVSTIVMTILTSTTVFADVNKGKMISGRTMIPLRGAFTDLGFEVSWDKTTNTATLNDDDHVIKVKKDDPKFSVDGVTYTSDVAPKLINGSVYIPLRSIGETIGATAAWDDSLQIASLSYNNDTAYVALGSAPKISKSGNYFEPDTIYNILDSEDLIIQDFNDGLDNVDFDTDNSWAISYFNSAKTQASSLKNMSFTNVSPSVKTNVTSFASYVDKCADAYIAAITAYENDDYEEAERQLDLAGKYTVMGNLYHDALIDFYNSAY